MPMRLPLSKDQAEDKRETSLERTNLSNQSKDSVIPSLDMVDVEVQEYFITCELVLSVIDVFPPTTMLVLIVNQTEEGLILVAHCRQWLPNAKWVTITKLIDPNLVVTPAG